MNKAPYIVVQVIALFALICLENGCMQTLQISKAEAATKADERGIMVYLYDGRIFRFYKGDYMVSDINGGSITGKGKQILDTQTGRSRQFEGSISFDGIEKITVTEATTAAYFMMAAAAVGVAFIGLIVYIMGKTGGSFH